MDLVLSFNLNVVLNIIGILVFLLFCFFQKRLIKTLEEDRYTFENEFKKFMEEKYLKDQEINNKLEDIRIEIAIINGKMTPPVYFSPREIQEKPPYTGAKRGPKPRPFLTPEE